MKRSLAPYPSTTAWCSINLSFRDILRTFFPRLSPLEQYLIGFFFFFSFLFFCSFFSFLGWLGWSTCLAKDVTNFPGFGTCVWVPWSFSLLFSSIGLVRVPFLLLHWGGLIFYLFITIIPLKIAKSAIFDVSPYVSRCLQCPFLYFSCAFYLPLFIWYDYCDMRIIVPAERRGFLSMVSVILTPFLQHIIQLTWAVYVFFLSTLPLAILFQI